jgi:hypothetical protein
LNRRTLEECFICGISLAEDETQAAKDKVPGSEAISAVTPLGSKAKRSKPRPKEDAERNKPRPKEDAERNKPRPKEEAKRSKPKPKEEAKRSKPRPKEEAKRSKPRPKEDHAKGGSAWSMGPALGKIVLLLRAIAGKIVLLLRAIAGKIVLLLRAIAGKIVLLLRAVAGKIVLFLWAVAGKIVLFLRAVVLLFFHALKGCLFLIAKGVLFTITRGKALLFLFKKSPVTLAPVAILALAIWLKCDVPSQRWIQAPFYSVSNYFKQVVSRVADAATSRVSPETDPLRKGPFLFIREPSVPGFPIMIASMITYAECQEFSSRFGRDPTVLSSRCIPNVGQCDRFFRHEPSQDWYVTLQFPGEFETVNIFRFGSTKNMLESVRGYLEKMSAFMKPYSSRPYVMHVISPQGEVDMARGQLKK